jgi:hypothetical protein
MLEERAGMRSTARPSRSLFPALGVHGRLALKTHLKSGVRIVSEQRNPRLVSYLFDFRRPYVGEERDGAPFGVGTPKDDAANLRRAFKSRGGELKNGERRAAGFAPVMRAAQSRSRFGSITGSPLIHETRLSGYGAASLQGPAPTRRSAPPNTGMRNGRGQITARPTSGLECADAWL